VGCDAQASPYAGRHLARNLRPVGRIFLPLGLPTPEASATIRANRGHARHGRGWLRTLSGTSHAVFISYASQDAEAAQKICEALREAGIDVFLDQSELRGGDAWDQKIRHEIHDCALFIPIVSQHTQERLEGYFRHEWKLAIERIHHMAEQKPFLVPVVVDDTRDQEAFVPDAFRAVQWTRLPGGDTSPAFVERIKRLLSPELSPMSAVSGATAAIREPVRASRRSKPVLLAIIAVVCAALAYLFVVCLERILIRITGSIVPLEAVWSRSANGLLNWPKMNTA
jgi:TIR domain